MPRLLYEPPINKKPVHKCKHLYLIPDKKKKFPCIGDIKKDGVYAYGLCTEHDNRIFSRTGMQYTSLHNLEYWLGMIWQDHKKDCIIIFEVQKEGCDVNTISGGCRRKTEQFVGAIGVCHDVIPYDDFIAGFCFVHYIERKQRLKDMFCMQHYPAFELSEGFYIRDEEDAYSIFDRKVELGEEGIIGRDPHGAWVAGKKNEVYWKIKLELSYDLIVTGMKEGKGKYKGTLGTLIVFFRKFGKEDGQVCYLPVSGMTDEQRNLWWNDKYLILSKIVKVDAMTFTKNGLLREPRFKEIREDKLEPDIL